MSVVYGYDVASTNDPYVEYAEQGVRAISKATDAKKAALLGIFPFCRSYRTSYPLTEFRSSPETTYMDSWFVQGRSCPVKALCNRFSQSSFWNGVRTNGAHFLLPSNKAAIRNFPRHLGLEHLP